MLPIDQFKAVWERCDHLSIIHAYISNNASPAIQPNELLRAEWAARVSGLDLYIHELVAQRLVAIFEGTLPKCPGYETFQLSVGAMDRIRNASTSTAAVAAFDLTAREHLERKTFQYADDIATGLRFCSATDIWNSVALHMGATPSTKNDEAKRIKKQLAQISPHRQFLP